MIKITKFYFDRAIYLIGNDHNEFLLIVDYKNNKFNFVGKKGTKGLKKEVAIVARDLLKRKSGINFADRI